MCRLRCYLLNGVVFLVAWTSVTPSPIVGKETSPPAVSQTLAVGKSYDGRLIECIVHGEGPDVLMVIATIHGNEAAGTPLVEAFSEWLTAHPAELAGRQVVIVPVAVLKT